MRTIGRSLIALALSSTVAYADASTPSSTPSSTKGCPFKDRAGMIDALRLHCSNVDDEPWDCRGARLVLAGLERCRDVRFVAPEGEPGPVSVIYARGKAWWLASFGPRAAGGERVLLGMKTRD